MKGITSKASASVLQLRCDTVILLISYPDMYNTTVLYVDSNFKLWSEFVETNATFRSASTDLDHA